MAKIAILYPSDPAGHAPSGIDAVIRGMLKWAPADLQYTLLGATTDEAARPVGREATLTLGERVVRFLPLVTMDAKAKRSLVPVVIRYMWALRRLARAGELAQFDILDFHRIEPVGLFEADRRPKNVIVHQDMSVIRDKNCDILWRHAPWLYERIEHRLFSHMDRIFSVRQSAVARYQKIYPDLSERIAFVPTWVDTSVFTASRAAEERQRHRIELRQSLGIDPANSRILVYVGRLDRQKDPLLLLQAFREARTRHPGLHLVVIGDGALRPQVEQSCRELRLDAAVTLLGVKPAVEILRVLRGSELFVLSSAYEGMPIAVLEALATGLPVVSTNVGEIPLVVHDGVSGRISAERSAPALASAIGTALEQCAAMSGEPAESAIAAYRPEKVLKSLYDNHRRQAAAFAASTSVPRVAETSDRSCA